MKMTLAAMTGAAALLAGTPCLAQPDANATAPTNSTSSSPTTSAAPANPSAASAGAIPAPPDGKGEIVFYRRWAFSGAAVWFNVRENGVQLGKLTNGVYFVVPADPGTHTYTAATENKDVLKLNIDPGETYYVEGRITMGLVIGEANLAPTDAAAFEKVAAKLKPAKVSPPPVVGASN